MDLATTFCPLRQLFLLLSFFQPFCYFTFESFGMKFVSSTLGALIIATIPLFTPIFTYFLAREKITLFNISGLIISFVGVIVVLANDFLSTGINFRFISNFKTDLSLIYSKTDNDDFDIHKHDYERIYPGFDESYYSFDYYQNIDPDTTYTNSTITNGVNNFEIKDWKVAIEVPFGVDYELNEIVEFFGGIGLKLIRQEFEYFEENEFSRWETDRYVAFVTTITPFKCLKMDVNFGYDFANFSNWQIDLKYLW